MSKYVKKEFLGFPLNKCIDKLSYGTQINKITKNGNGNLRAVTYFINEDDPSQLQWISDAKEYWRSRIDLLSIKSITECPTAKYCQNNQAYYPKVLRISYGTTGELVLIFNTPNDKFEWWCGLQHFILLAQEAAKKG